LRMPIRMAQLQLLNVHKEKDGLDLVRKIQKDGDSLMWPTEMIQIINCASAVKNLTGDFAEVGVYQGRSAKLLSEVSGDRTLHLFDTFEGLPKPSARDAETLRINMYAANLNTVKRYLSDYRRLIFYPGTFPETAEAIKDKSFAFVHFDVDLYQSTLECLRFFYSRMAKGGIILSHDYSTLAGVKRAFDEFLADKNESVIELSTSQCILVKE
jgi:O-methyltransferase